MICKQKNCAEEVQPPRTLFCSKECLNRYSSHAAHLRNIQKKYMEQPTVVCKQKNCNCLVKLPRKVFCSDKCKNLNGVYKTREQNKVKAVNLLGGKCQECGYDRCLGALDFHHLDPTKKDFAISSSTKGWTTIKKEIEKCVLLCANCHREVHCGMLKVSVRAVTPAR